METLLVPAPVREKLGNAGSDGLVMMFAEAHRIGFGAAHYLLGVSGYGRGM